MVTEDHHLFSGGIAWDGLESPRTILVRCVVVRNGA